jgi:hypothetical protein
MTDIPRLVEKQLTDGSVWTHRDFMHHHDGLLAAIRSSGSERPLYAASVLAALLSPDLRVRTGAVGVLDEIVGDVGADRVATILRDNEALFRGVKPAWRISAEDLEQAATMAVASGVQAGDTTAIAWLRKVARDRKWGAYAFNALARVDGDWLVANARGLVPHTHLGVLSNLRPDLRFRYIDAQAPWPAEKPDFFTKAFWSGLSTEEAARLRGRMWPGVRA